MHESEVGNVRFYGHHMGTSNCSDRDKVSCKGSWREKKQGKDKKEQMAGKNA